MLVARLYGVGFHQQIGGPHFEAAGSYSPDITRNDDECAVFLREVGRTSGNVCIATKISDPE